MRFNTLFQLLAMQRDRSPLLDAAETLLFIPDLFHYFFTGIKVNEVTDLRAKVRAAGGSYEVVKNTLALKAIEGTIRSLLDAIRGELESSVRGKLGGLLIRPGARRVRKRLDPEEYGGAYLLGLRGLVVIAHGSSSRVAIANAVRLAARGVEHDVVERLAQRLPDRVVASARSTTPTAER